MKLKVIDMDALKERFKNAPGFLAAIESIPEADIERKGCWRFGRNEYGHEYHCSECDFIVGFPHEYCANCGARMDGERNAGV